MANFSDLFFIVLTNYEEEATMAKLKDICNFSSLTSIIIKVLEMSHQTQDFSPRVDLVGWVVIWLDDFLGNIFFQYHKQNMQNAFLAITCFQTFERASYMFIFFLTSLRNSHTEKLGKV